MSQTKQELTSLCNMIVTQTFFQVNDEHLRTLLTNAIKAVLALRIDIRDYRVVCDHTINTPEMVDLGWYPAVDIWYQIDVTAQPELIEIRVPKPRGIK